jgi:hypothetical protein
VPSGAKVTLHRGHLIVFTGPGAKKQIRACWGTKSRSVVAGVRRECDSDGNCEQAPLTATAGSCVAANDTATISGTAFYKLYVVDVRRRVFWNFRSSQPSPGAQGVGIGPATDVVMTKRCAVAWIASNTYGGPPELRLDDGRGRGVIAQGNDIDLHSLTLKGSTVTWTQAGVKHHTRLVGRPRGGLPA